MHPSRTPMVVGNWKAGPPRTEAIALGRRLVETLTPLSGESLELVICPPFPWLTDVSDAVAGSGIAVGAQTMAAVDGGGATGEISASLLRGICSYVLLGHYERRILCHERDGDVRKKVEAALAGNIHPILCVGENADALEEGMGPVVVEEQLEAALDGLNVTEDLVVAYAPSWTTIGMITPPGADYANDVCATIRESLSSIASPSIAEKVRLIYGGRLTGSAIDDVVAQPEIDGILVGAGATSADVFTSLASAVVRARPA